MLQRRNEPGVPSNGFSSPAAIPGTCRRQPTMWTVGPSDQAAARCDTYAGVTSATTAPVPTRSARRSPPASGSRRSRALAGSRNVERDDAAVHHVRSCRNAVARQRTHRVAPVAIVAALEEVPSGPPRTFPRHRPPHSRGHVREHIETPGRQHVGATVPAWWDRHARGARCREGRNPSWPTWRPGRAGSAAARRPAELASDWCAPSVVVVAPPSIAARAHALASNPARPSLARRTVGALAE